jgi:hypothetical protein
MSLYSREPPHKVSPCLAHGILNLMLSVIFVRVLEYRRNHFIANLVRFWKSRCEVPLDLLKSIPVGRKVAK